MRKVLRVTDSIGDWAGKSVRWLLVALFLLVSLEVVLRYVFNSPTAWALETHTMTGGTILVVALSYAQRRDSHIRIDVLYARLSRRTRAGIDVIGGLVCFFPFVLLFIATSAFWMWKAWLTGERGIETCWYPPLAPFRTVVMIGFVLFALQGTARFIRDLHFLIRNKSFD